MLESIFDNQPILPDNLFGNQQAQVHPVKSKPNKSKPPSPTTAEKQLEAELWSALADTSKYGPCDRAST